MHKRGVCVPQTDVVLLPLLLYTSFSSSWRTGCVRRSNHLVLSRLLILRWLAVFLPCTERTVHRLLPRRRHHVPRRCCLPRSVLNAAHSSGTSNCGTDCPRAVVQPDPPQAISEPPHPTAPAFVRTVISLALSRPSPTSPHHHPRVQKSDMLDG
eukprot:COSAG02_NODE_6768_length_3370_cov_5.094161_5_plen_154_part_00